MNKNEINCVICGTFIAITISTVITPLICKNCEHENVIHPIEQRFLSENNNMVSMTVSGGDSSVFSFLK